MSDTLEKVTKLALSGDIRISEHRYEELAADGLTAHEIVSGIASAALVEDYPDYPKGASILVLQADQNRQPVHVVWGIPRGHERPAVLVTAYRPDRERWNSDFKKRKK